MHAPPEIIELLNDVLTAELTAVNQYFGHAKMQANWGYQRLAEHAQSESMDEMRHADDLIERILYLEGMPNMQRLGSVRLGEDPVEQLRLDLELEREAVTASTGASRWQSSTATTAPVTYWRRCSPPRRTTSTGWRRSLGWSSTWVSSAT
jgi:bacterioferritin